ncbi:MAG: ABC transporter permease [Nitrospiraceae bacterium]|jgi:ABC-type dipeptide/oligopeptide/nickel transport system permease component|nr:ABC transporter permease [Nitrospiraceae bacterium]
MQTMKSYILKRFVLLIPLLLGITLVSFAMLKSLPGDPVLNLVGERASPEAIESIRRELGTDQGFFRQYAGYLSLLAQGDFGRSYHTNRQVSEELRRKFPNTMRLALATMAIAVPAGILLGVIAAVRRNTIIDRMVQAVTIAGVSIPVFWFGIMLMLLVCLHLRLLPPSGTGGVQFIVLPALVLAVPAAATLARVTRTSVLDAMTMPHVRTAQARGASRRRILLWHVLRNALIPIVTIIGLDFGSYLNGAVVTETIFGWDGIGRFTMDGILKRDYPVIMGCTMIGTVVFVLVNLVTDLLYHYLDPRIRLDEKNR